MTYSDKLKDPRWQKKRLRVMERDKWTCVLCGDSENTLHIHHDLYNGSNPWDTPEEYLKTLCSYCHELVELFKKDAPECSILKIFKIASISNKGNYLFTIIASEQGVTENWLILLAYQSGKYTVFPFFKKAHAEFIRNCADEYIKMGF